MTNHHSAAPAPLVTTVQQQSPASTVERASISVKDISIVLGIVVAITIIMTFFLNRGSAKRKEDQDEAQRRTDLIMSAITKSHDDSARDVRELSEKVKDGRTVLEKDIQSLSTALRHEKSSRETLDQAMKHSFNKTNEEITKLRDRITVQETDSKHQNDELKEMKALLREKTDEMKELITRQGDTTTAQIKELSVSIREAREAALKG